MKFYETLDLSTDVFTRWVMKANSLLGVEEPLIKIIERASHFCLQESGQVLLLHQSRRLKEICLILKWDLM